MFRPSTCSMLLGLTVVITEAPTRDVRGIEALFVDILAFRLELNVSGVGDLSGVTLLLRLRGCGYGRDEVIVVVEVLPPNGVGFSVVKEFRPTGTRVSGVGVPFFVKVIVIVEATGIRDVGVSLAGLDGRSDVALSSCSCVNVALTSNKLVEVFVGNTAVGNLETVS